MPMTKAEKTRGFIGIILVLVIAVSMYIPIQFPVHVSKDTYMVYHTMKKLKPGSVVWIAYDYGPNSATENLPQTTGFIRQAMMDHLKVILFSFDLLGPSVVQPAAARLAKQFHYKYGVNWVNIGYKPSPVQTLLAMRRSIVKAVAGTDYKGASLAKMPIFKSAPRLSHKYIKLIAEVNVGTPGAGTYLTYVVTPLHIPMVVATISVLVPAEQAYVQSHQYQGLIAGMPGAAQYEHLLGQKTGPALSGMSSETLGVLLMILLIVVGNVIGLRKRGRDAV